MPSLHDFLRLPVVLLHVESAHKFSADRLRDKLCSYRNVSTTLIQRGSEFKLGYER